MGVILLLKKFTEMVYKHIKGNLIIYFLVCMFFIIGISSGAFTVKALSSNQKQELIAYMRNFFQILHNKPINEFSVLKQSLTNNLQTSLFIWLLGITVIGIPLILLLIAIRGFIIGFTVGFLIEQLKMNGILFSVISILPQNLFIIPSLLAIAVISIGFSTMVIKNRLNKSHNAQNTFKQFILYTTINTFIFSFIILGSVIEAYVTPVFMRLFSQYM